MRSAPCFVSVCQLSDWNVRVVCSELRGKLRLEFFILQQHRLIFKRQRVLSRRILRHPRCNDLLTLPHRCRPLRTTSSSARLASAPLRIIITWLQPIGHILLNRCSRFLASPGSSPEGRSGQKPLATRCNNAWQMPGRLHASGVLFLLSIPYRSYLSCCRERCVSGASTDLLALHACSFSRQACT
jgi:hypothetical protein